MKKGLYTGRFQPFHLGHLSVVKQALKEVDFLYIGIGSAQCSHSRRNPLSSDERTEIIKKALKESGILSKKYKIIPLPDIHDNKAWPSYVQTMIPKFDIVFTGEDGIVKELFDKYTKFPVKVAKRVEKVSATIIREAIRNKKKWENLVCDSTANFIKKSDIKKRLKHPTRSCSTRIGKLPIV